MAPTEIRRRQDELHVETWGTGVPVILVHGSLATGAEEWEAQRPLADEGFLLRVVDRRGYGRSPAADGEDFIRDADDLVALIDEAGSAGAHLVGHSYGGLGVFHAAARRPHTTRSLTLLEPATFELADGVGDPAAQALVEAVRARWDDDLPDLEWVVNFLTAVGSDPADFPPEFLAVAAPLVPVLRRGRPFWDPGLPVSEVAAAPFPKLVVSGGHSAGFDAMCRDLADRIGGSWTVVEGAGHEIQFTGPPINQLMRALWRTSSG